MAYDAFLKLDGIPGENEDGSFEVLSFSFGVSDGGDLNNGGGGGRVSGKATEIDFSIVKKTDSASPKLFVASATGKQITRGELTLVPAVQEGGGAFQYKVTFTNLLVDSVRVKGSVNGDDRPLEEVNFDFQKVVIVSDDVSGGFDFRTGRAV